MRVNDGIAESVSYGVSDDARNTPREHLNGLKLSYVPWMGHSCRGRHCGIHTIDKKRRRFSFTLRSCTLNG